MLAGELVVQDREEGFLQPHDPADGQEQPQASRQGQDESQLPGPALLSLGEAVGQDRDEDDVVDAQDDLHQGQGQEAEPHLGGEQALKFEHAFVLSFRSRGV